MLIEFTKMHGLGNDFMVIDLVTQRLDLTKDLVQLLGDRHLGIGFDQLLVVEPPMRPDVDFSYRIFNTDGTGLSNAVMAPAVLPVLCKRASYPLNSVSVLRRQAALFR